MRITIAGDVQIQHTVTRNLVEHMLEDWLLGFETLNGGPVETKFQRYLRF